MPMDGIDDSHVEETQDGINSHVNEHHIFTQGRERGKWVVNVIDSAGNVTEERLTAKDVWGMEKRRIILEFGPHDQPDGGSGGVFGTWLGMLSTDLTKFPINYDDWRNVQQWRNDDAWDYIQNLREQNKISRSHYKTPHTLGKKSISRVSKEVFLKTGKRPSRAEIFVSSRQKANGGYVNEEAHDLSEKLTKRMVHTRENTSNIRSKDDEFSQVFGPERPGRVRCVGLDPTPSSFFKNRTSYETEVIGLRNTVRDLHKKMDKMNDLEDTYEKMNEGIVREGDRIRQDYTFHKERNILPCDQESSSFYSSEVDRNLLRVSRPRATTDPAISGSEQSKRDSRLTRSNSACGLDSVELELDFVFTSSSDSKQLDFGQGYLVGSRSLYWA
ncbi:unnamed protein product [Microthlaspi erraticum]|uniref:Uncharacterized protein n=1 Tax=Microthlaspi erraticum TaxID=1685480 RepID=A0A6D2HFT8_9BRAS|nr:unnamed protein product [Microthlaspi erraticum]